MHRNRRRNLAWLAMVLLLGAGLAALIVVSTPRDAAPAAAAELAGAPAPETDLDSAAAEPRCKRGTPAVPRAAKYSKLGQDCRALLAIEAALAGTATLNWSSNTPIADWDGISLYKRRVAGIALDNQSLTGTLPAGLGQLTALRTLRLKGNALTGAIPPELGQLSLLRVLDLSGNSLTGSLPHRLAELAHLRELRVSGNALTGCAAPVLHTIRTHDLATANLAACASTCDVGLAVPRPLATPDLVTDCKTLLGLKTVLANTLYPLNWHPGRALGSWTGVTVADGRVTELTLEDRRPGGPWQIPADLGKLTGLTRLDLNNYAFTGPIPAELGRLTGLTHLNLSKNKITGAFPAALSALTKLRHLNLAFTDLTGCIPHALRHPSGVTRYGLEWCPPPTQTLTVTVTGGGSVSPGGASTHPQGTQVTLTASWDPATHTFSGWGGACSGTAMACVLTMDADKTVTATFAAKPNVRTLTVTVTGTGAVTPSGASTHADGAERHLDGDLGSAPPRPSRAGAAIARARPTTCELTMDADRSGHGDIHRQVHHHDRADRGQRLGHPQRPGGQEHPAGGRSLRHGQRPHQRRGGRGDRLVHPNRPPIAARRQAEANAAVTGEKANPAAFPAAPLASVTGHPREHHLQRRPPARRGRSPSAPWWRRPPAPARTAWARPRPRPGTAAAPSPSRSRSPRRRR